ncbi:acetyl/propionyl-CoA carboxylase alpha subunit [Rhizobium tibeticum]|uniref:acetyl-CoA carboxylase biotin carboxyl carrier protein subunit n=1 Tax=Rhizobium tibeticum TaxID=501024 RepID=UPI002781D482|nr:acetyl-CoA carboxylase biotin carboxyl carrier protein subunit [Rhizobium tibeticum]MDP9811464.1 acetyl/propionyl-CoA carboxylase alpha subunit [Rhizobium tibeticum]
MPFHRAVLEERDFTGENGFRVHTNWIETAFKGIEPAPRVDPVEGGLICSFIEIDGKRHGVGLPAALFAGLSARQTPPVSNGPTSGHAVIAPIPGTLQKWLVADGVEVAEGEPVALIEAMKMETRVLAPQAGRIHITAEPGTMAALAAELATID